MVSFIRTSATAAVDASQSDVYVHHPEVCSPAVSGALPDTGRIHQVTMPTLSFTWCHQAAATPRASFPLFPGPPPTGPRCLRAHPYRPFGPDLEVSEKPSIPSGDPLSCADPNLGIADGLPTNQISSQRPCSLARCRGRARSRTFNIGLKFTPETSHAFSPY